MTTREQLKQKYDRFRQDAFPAAPTQSGQLSEIRNDLVEYDGHIAGIAESILAGASVDRELLQPDRQLRSRLELLRDNSSAPTDAEAAEYLDYLGRLEELLDLAVRAAYM